MITVLDPGDAPTIAIGDILYVDADQVDITSKTDTAGSNFWKYQSATSTNLFWYNSFQRNLS